MEIESIKMPLFAAGRGDTRRMQIAVTGLIDNLKLVIKWFQDQAFEAGQGLGILLDKLHPFKNTLR